MNILLLGGGLQGRAVLHDLAKTASVEAITCADCQIDRVQSYLQQLRCRKAKVVHLDATDESSLRRLMGGGFDAVIDMLPRDFGRPVAEAAIQAGVHLVNSHYDHELRSLRDQAVAADIAILPEMGMDPGIDLVLAAEAVRRFDKVHRLDSYGGGIPEPGADDNPLRYKISWTFDGVLSSYVRPARLMRNGVVIEIPGNRIFEDEVVHTIEVEPFGTVEAFPNGDALSYAARFGIEAAVQTTGRYALRWPGHARIWQVFSRLGFLEDTPNPALEQISPRRFLCRHLEPRLQYGNEERDVVIIRIVAEGEGYSSPRLTLEVIDYRDTQSGLMAMNRTVGYPASIAAQMIVSGTINGRGLLSPTKHVPYGLFVAELRERGIQVRETTL
ncbi:MAG: saccharopine dehydrogenase NADP-binding domain-containing protein [Phycisphaerales bacterium]|nr:MAG: saccharopine dehydrogenase NADP-binding domain-containing protein [Phycisphaerales bacterium]